MPKPLFITKYDKQIPSKNKFVGKLRKYKTNEINSNDFENTVCVEVPMLFTFGSIYSTTCLLYIE